MKQSILFCKTEKEAPKEADTISHKLLLRGGFIDQLISGVYSFLPLGLLVSKKICNIIKEEMNAIGGQEVFLPTLQPKNIWEQTDRWEHMDPPLFKLKDRHDKELALGPTHEEVITQLAVKNISSYRDLPLYLYQIQTKFRNEMRFSGGLLRTREFLMKDLYSFHADMADFQDYYKKAASAYFKIFKRCGLDPVMVEASGLGFTNDFTHEFQVLTDAGEDTVLYCPKCSFARNKEIAKLKEGDKCPDCLSPLKLERGIEIGNIFPLGEKYAKAFNLYFLDKDGQKKLVIMGCYGIGIGRLMATVIEMNHDENGIIWPKEIAPFTVHLLSFDHENHKVGKVADKIYQDLQKAGIEVLYDDRIKVSPGQKLAESDLLGMPIRLIVGEKNLAKNKVGLKHREKKMESLVSISSIKTLLKKWQD
ncbi:MAG: proline--tRNA ligase [Candidatus Paceibacterota bacterium]|jgi:prolyl-tRNA synthetase|nr:proline--tRNA ligase [Candidatus Paceibacterota bacterium]